jgi:hypothetical protein
MGIVETVSNLLTRAADCANESRSIQSKWSEVEKEIFEILISTSLRPLSATIQTGGEESFFQLDWTNRRLIQVSKDTIVVDLKRVSDAGKILANTGEEIQNVY